MCGEFLPIGSYSSNPHAVYSVYREARTPCHWGMLHEDPFLHNLPGSTRLLTLYGIGLRNHGMTFLWPVGRTSKYRLKVKYSIKVSSGFKSSAPNLRASVRLL